MSESHDLEAALRGLTPLTPSLDRDQLMFQAGRASRPGSGRYWAIATSLLALALAPLALRVALDPPKPVKLTVFQVPAPQPQLPPVVPSVEPESTPHVTEERWGRSPDLAYFRMEKSVLRWGLDGLQPSPPPSGPVRAPEPLPRLRGQGTSDGKWGF